MATLRQIVTDGYRESGLTAVGATPEADEFDEGLRKLEIIINSLIGNQFSDKLESLSYGNSGLVNTYAKGLDRSDEVDTKYAPSGVRLVFNNAEATTIYLDPNPQDGARFAVIDNSGNFATYNVILSGNGRKIETVASVTLATNSLQREWLYRSDLGSWQRITDLTDSDESPFPTDFDDYLAILLAMRINPRYHEQTSQETMMFMRRYENQFRSRYRQTIQPEVEEGLLRVGDYRWISRRYSSNDRFNLGI